MWVRTCVLAYLCGWAGGRGAGLCVCVFARYCVCVMVGLAILLLGVGISCNHCYCRLSLEMTKYWSKSCWNSVQCAELFFFMFEVRPLSICHYYYYYSEWLQPVGVITGNRTWFDRTSQRCWLQESSDACGSCRGYSLWQKWIYFFNYFGFYGPNIVLSCQKKQNKKTRTLTAGYYVINDGVRPLEAINRQDQKSPLPYDRYFVSPQNESHYVLPR